MSIRLEYFVEGVANEKDVPEQVIYDAIESTVASIIAKRIGVEPEYVRVEVDKKQPGFVFSSYRVFDVVADDEVDVEPEETDEDEEEVEGAATRIGLTEARQENEDIQIGDQFLQSLAGSEFDRIDAHQAKMLLTRLVRDAEWHARAARFEEKLAEGTLYVGEVKWVNPDRIKLDISEGADHVEAEVPRSQMLPREIVRKGDCIRAYLYKVNHEPRGAVVFLSRTCGEMLSALFELEVPEIGEGVIEIMNVVRDPGNRSKIAVKSNDKRIDPVGACVGMRGARVMAVSNELNGERVDVIQWDADPVQWVMNALGKVEVLAAEVDQDNKIMDLAISEDQLSIAIGKSGQNIRLASALTGWTLNVMTQEELETRKSSDQAYLLRLFSEALDVGEDIAGILIREGYSTLKGIAGADLDAMATIPEFNEDIAEELSERARSALLESALDEDQAGRLREPKEDLIKLQGMNKSLAYRLAEHGIVSRDDLAELSVDDLDMIEDLDEATAAELIMSARAHWFRQSENGSNE